MKVKGFTLLTYEQVFSNQALKIFEKYGRGCSATDFAWLLGIDGGIGPSYLTSDGGRAVKWFTQTDSARYREVYIIDDDGSKNSVDADFNDIGGRPAIMYSTIFPFVKNQVRLENGILEVEYGEYPQYVVSKKMSDDLEIEYTNGRLKTTGKVYKIGSREFTEYEYKGKRLIRAKANDNGWLSSGRKFGKLDCFWVEVSPIKWLVDEEKNIAISKKVIFSGVGIQKYSWASGVYKEQMSKFLNKQFAKDIIPSNQKKQSWFARLFSKKQKTPLALPPTQIPQEEIK